MKQVKHDNNSMNSSGGSSTNNNNNNNGTYNPIMECEKIYFQYREPLITPLLTDTLETLANTRSLNELRSSPTKETRYFDSRQVKLLKHYLSF